MRNFRLYYSLKPLLPRAAQIWVRQVSARLRRRHVAGVWPIQERAGREPAGWRGWPEGKQFALVLTHDVETARGVDRCRRIMDIEERAGFRSAFNFVPERYKVPAELRREVVQRGFEVGVHGLYHDLTLFRSEKEFRRQADDINRYLRDWGSVGFRSPYMIRNLQWIHDYLNVEYDTSTFDTDPFEPHPAGVGTIFPFVVRGASGMRPGYVELPCTLPQDLNLFVLLGETGIEVWKRKLEWIVGCGGMALFDTHPDYMQQQGRMASDEYPVQRYVEFLEHVRTSHAEKYWHALPKAVAQYARLQHYAPVDPAKIEGVAP
jgi:peptidoglycan/xylan/chitin deacetylase (PgdA/CDA1 family)